MRWVGWLFSMGLVWGATATAQVVPADRCADAPLVGFGEQTGVIAGATADGTSSCSAGNGTPDVWYAVSATTTSNLFFELTSDGFEPTLSVHRGCPGTSANQVRCGTGTDANFDVALVAGETVHVRLAGGTGAFAFAVGPPAVISGTVFDRATGAPIPGLEILVRPVVGGFGTTATTNAAGRYSVGGLHSGEYRVAIFTERPYIPQVWPDIDCPFGIGDGCDLEDGDRIAVELGMVRDGVDFALDLGGTIEGHVTAAATGEPLTSAQVELYTSLGSFLDEVSADANGRYRHDGLGDGNYYVRARAQGPYRPEVWDDLGCPSGCDVTAGTPIPVAVGVTVSSIDFALERQGSIRGRVVDGGTGLPLDRYTVEAHAHSSGFTFDRAPTNDDGVYEISGLAPGTYYVRTSFASHFDRPDPYLDEIYDDLPCPGPFGLTDCDPTVGEPITVGLDEVVSDIDFTLTFGGTISGEVTAVATGEPIAFTRVSVYDEAGTRAYSTGTDANGRYRITGLDSGTYYVGVDGSQVDLDGFVAEVYNDLTCHTVFALDCDVTAGTPVTVIRDRDTGGIDFALRRLGQVSGTVLDASTGLPASGIVEAWDTLGRRVRNVLIGDDGTYSLVGLGASPVFVTTSTQLVDEVWDDIACDDGGFGLACDPTIGSPIPVVPDTVSAGIDFALEIGGAIEGVVLDRASGQPIGFADLELWTTGGDRLRFVDADASGQFRVDGLRPGAYLLGTGVGGDYLDEFWEGVPCPNGLRNCDFALGAPIVVTNGQVTGGIDFHLQVRGDRIQGRVVDEATGLPVRGFSVQILNADGSHADFASVRNDGTYRSRILAAGSYYARTSGISAWLDELWDDIPCPFGSCFVDDGRPIFVHPVGPAPVVDFALRRGGTITGTLRDAASGNPIDPGSGSAFVRAYDITGTARRIVGVGPQGTFALEGLATRSYYLVAEVDGFVDQLWDGLPCEGGCDPLDGDPLAVVAGEVVGGIDFRLVRGSLAGCTPSQHALCLAEGRFQVEIDWQTATASGRAQAVRLTPDSGYFWFFRPENVESLVKVLDACTTFDRFWFFAAGLTNVAATVRVTDTATGAVQTYRNPAGVPFQPIQDTQAFATCAAPFDPAVAAPPPPSTRGVGPCVDDDETLCVDDGRFAVRATWRTPNGETGPGTAVSLTNDTGYFWFFRPQNIEAIVKVLDACATVDRFWFFAGGLTNVEVELEVRDLVSGQVRRYTNPSGTRFQPVQDTQAFATCP